MSSNVDGQVPILSTSTQLPLFHPTKLRCESYPPNLESANFFAASIGFQHRNFCEWARKYCIESHSVKGFTDEDGKCCVFISEPIDSIENKDTKLNRIEDYLKKKSTKEFIVEKYKNEKQNDLFDQTVGYRCRDEIWVFRGQKLPEVSEFVRWLESDPKNYDDLLQDMQDSPDIEMFTDDPKIILGVVAGKAAFESVRSALKKFQRTTLNHHANNMNSESSKEEKQSKKRKTRSSKKDNSEKEAKDDSEEEVNTKRRRTGDNNNL